MKWAQKAVARMDMRTKTLVERKMPKTLARTGVGTVLKLGCICGATAACSAVPGS